MNSWGSYVDMVQVAGDADVSAKDGKTELESGDEGHTHADSGDVKDALTYTWIREMTSNPALHFEP